MSDSKVKSVAYVGVTATNRDSAQYANVIPTEHGHAVMFTPEFLGELLTKQKVDPRIVDLVKRSMPPKTYCSFTFRNAPSNAPAASEVDDVLAAIKQDQSTDDEIPF